jgi:diadenosine tetraphosphate (Ap4A) HIT family hydrolase
VESCPFCDFRLSDFWAEVDVAVALPGAYALTEGHTLVILRKHASSIYELNLAEQAEIEKFVSAVCDQLLAK